MKGRKLFRSRRLRFEGLEERSLLAAVSFSGGILRITGDNTPEMVAVTEAPPGTLTVTGTGIVTPFVRSGVVGIVADMKAGDDILDIGEFGIPVNLPGSVNIRLGLDSDTTNLFINTPAAVTVDGGTQTGMLPQDESINVTDSNIGALVVNAYAGNDVMVVDNSFFRSLVANLGAASLTTGQVDADSFTMTAGGATGATVNLGTAEMGATNFASITGADFAALVINGGNRVDEVTLEDLQISSLLAINTFGGDDTVTLTDVDARRINIFVGAGSDSVTLDTVNALSGVIDGGFQSGSALQDDTVELLDSDLGAFVVNTYAGDDTVTVTDSFFTSLVANLGVGSLTSGQVDADNFQMEGGGATTAVINVGTAQANTMNLVGINGAEFTTLVVNGGAGADNVLLAGLQVSNAVVINTFGGIDTIGLITVTATNQVSIFAGAGNDIVELEGVTTALAILNGGTGFDTLTDDLSPNIGTRIKSGFEDDDPLF